MSEWFCLAATDAPPNANPTNPPVSVPPIEAEIPIRGGYRSVPLSMRTGLNALGKARTMTTRLHCSNPHGGLRRQLVGAIRGADHFDAAVAFVTQAGFDFLRDALKPQRPSFRIVASIRWPTDIRAMAELATEFPGSTWIHLAGNGPQEKSGDKYQMHSKAVAIERRNDFVGFVGSHNWTFTALDGLNLEATVEVSCASTDSFASELRAHLEACIQESEPFDASQIDTYLEIQRRLHCGPPGNGGVDVEDFDKYSAVVIHAEDPTGLVERSQLRLSVGPDEPLAGEYMHERRVDLYLYPPGALIGVENPTEMPVLFEGVVTMVNTKSDASVEEREVDTAIDDLARPVIRPVAQFPDFPGASREVAIRLERRGKREPFVYHCGANQARPAVHDRVDFSPEPIPGLPPVDLEAAKRVRCYIRTPRFAGMELQREVPATVRREVSVNVPNPKLYPRNPELILRDRLDRGTHEIAAVPQAKRRLQREVEERFLINPQEPSYALVYGVTHRSKR